jgi:hypothetical protein
VEALARDGMHEDYWVVSPLSCCHP